jgi:hypothetical protein
MQQASRWPRCCWEDPAAQVQTQRAWLSHSAGAPAALAARLARAGRAPASARRRWQVRTRPAALKPLLLLLLQTQLLLLPLLLLPLRPLLRPLLLSLLCLRLLLQLLLVVAAVADMASCCCPLRLLALQLRLPAGGPRRKG